MSRSKKGALLVLSILIALYFIGPSPATPEYSLSWPDVPETNGLDAFVRTQESRHRLKPENEARVIWACDSTPSKTRYAIVYLHGFSASAMEGDPVHRRVAHRLGANLYLSRLSEHGIDTIDQLVRLTPDSYWASAKQALAIGAQLGEKVILMGTSTGATQAIQLAAAYPDKVHALVLYSPNIAINDPFAFLLNNPWGLTLARWVKGGNYNDPADERPVYKKYWNKPYRLEAAVALQEMLETTMKPSTYARVKQPVLMLYYYRDKVHQDSVVRVDAMKDMFARLGTPDSLKQAIAVPRAGDHVIASPVKSADIQSVESFTINFLSGHCP